MPHTTSTATSLSEPDLPWWKTAVIYQIYPISFFDSNGDGIGDLNGITSKLDYLKDLGVDVLWLSPIYRSPLADMGYDISDYQDIDPRYGTLADWDALLAGAHERGMKLMMDLVVNHSSDEHDWFVQSRSDKSHPKRDWYIWRPPKYDAAGSRQPPNNWKAVFQGSAWEYDAHTNEYYLHLYLPKQPDLNWDNPQVRDAVWKLMKFWLDRGRTAFRTPLSRYPETFKRNEGFWNANFTENHDHSRSVSRFGNDSDKWRALSAKMLAMMQVTQGGTQFVYQGQELGLKNFPRTWGIEEYKDVASQNYWHKILAKRKEESPGVEIDTSDILDDFAKKARDHARVPMQWSAAPHAGFTTGTPWMRVNEDYENWNAESQGHDADSVRTFWKDLLRIRKENSLLVCRFLSREYLI
ncbi:hypothetical protein D9611_009770 [Ephemerocybe angulata]|uniref:Glycosyl hydrolase family 13 catalytic domain-containing protein n=1 Tax=Ephemerocybe angulata TaxID=980116 RepID=A0A8H5CCI9_9AGAR|nr:hypothetical protein D9611_009770 [Tulosesus angulatus]